MPSDPALPHPRLGRMRAGLVFGAAIGTSSILLFTSEPMVGRLVLPVFGGAPAVWATVLVFFQVLLLLGYLYAHLLATRTRPLVAAAVHLGVMALAAAATVLGPRDIAGLHDPAIPVIPGLLAILLLVIGPAAFAMTATTPLLSAWYARVRRAGDPTADVHDPYWLYALSNGGSLVALLAYPLLVEPNLGLSAQRAACTGAFVVLTGLIALVVLRLRAAGPGATRPASDEHRDPVAQAVGRAPGTADTQPTARERLVWLTLAAVPAGLLSAVTNLVTTDLIAAPLLWVIPLATYLASFVIAFSARGRRVVPAAVVLAPATLTLLWVPLGSVAGWPLVALLAIEYGGLGIVAVAVHGRLAARRPDERHLTGFYLVMSAGGAMGGAFVALVAPVLFDGVWEYPILVAAALGVLAATTPLGPPRRPIAALLHDAPARLVPYAAVALPLAGWMAVSNAPGADLAVRSVALGGLLLLVGGSPKFLAAATSVVLVIAVLLVPAPVQLRDRSFFGVVEVLRDGVRTVLMHGTTRHGSQWREPAIAGRPLDYYAPSGPVGDLFTARDDRPNLQIRVVGLGAGAIAAYARPGDTMVFYEIDPLVAAVATDTRWFTFLADAPGTDLRIGDGRLLMADEPDDTLDLVIMDAFSSDSVPAHLLTVEAFADVDRSLREDGVVAVHVSNRYYDLAAPVAAALATRGYTVLERLYTPVTEAQVEEGGTGTRFVAATRDPAVVARLRAAGWTLPATDAVPLTDDRPDLLRYLTLFGG